MTKHSTKKIIDSNIKNNVDSKLINKKLLKIFNKLKQHNVQHNKDHIIILDDSMNVLTKLEKKTIDLIFADPPYNIGKKFGENKENFTKDNYIQWCKNWIDESMRILKDDGVLCFMTATQFMPYLDCYVDSKYDVFSRIIWYYDSSGVQAKSSFGSMYEPILIVCKDKNAVKFNSKNVMVEAKTGSVRKLIDYRKTPPQKYNNKKVMGNVWNIPRVRFRMDEYETHPTQKPEKLIENIILAFTQKNDIVIDPFAGTFTTCAVSQKNDRLSIGIEYEEEYYKIGLRRVGISDEYKGMKLIKSKRRVTKNKSKISHMLNSTFR